MSRVHLTVAEVSRIYRVPQRTLRRWVTEGRLVDHADVARGCTRPRRHLLAAVEVEQIISLLRRGGT